MKKISTFIEALRLHKSTDVVTNPYRDTLVANNLRLYLEQMVYMKGRHVLLVGEAPGYRGCRITGIPFTSGRVFERISHPLLNTLENQLEFSEILAEPTATIVWEYLARKGSTPVFWNAFPFHPHAPGNTASNRSPTAAEVEIGAHYLRVVGAIFEPEIIAGIGRKGQQCASMVFPGKDIIYIAHPSHGGKRAFIAGMNGVFSPGYCAL